MPLSWEQRDDQRHKSLAGILQQLETHRYTVRAAEPKSLKGYELFLGNPSDWKLRSSNKTPLIWVKVDILTQLSEQQLIEGLQDIANQQGWRHQVCLVLLEGDGAELRQRTIERYFPRFVMIDAAQARNILTARAFTAALLDLVCDQILDFQPGSLSDRRGCRG